MSIKFLKQTWVRDTIWLWLLVGLSILMLGILVAGQAMTIQWWVPNMM
jgi:hypothetical protein